MYPLCAGDRSFSEHGNDFAVGVTDGQTKVTIMQSIVAIVNGLVLHLNRRIFCSHMHRLSDFLRSSLQKN